MRDYGDLLAADLRARGRKVDVEWVDNDTLDLRMTVRSTRAFLALARRIPGGTQVVWNYAPTNIGFRAVPGPAVLFGLVLRARGDAPLTVLHELAQRWREQPWTTRARAVLQSALLGFVLAGSREVLVTTPQRERRLRRLLRLTRTPVAFAPVFSNFPPPRPVPPPETSETGAGAPFVLVVPDHDADFARRDVVVDAVARLQAGGRVRLVLLGSPGPDSPGARIWRDLASAAGVHGALEWTGVLSYDDFTRWLLRAHVIVLPNAQGPSCRKGTLAAAVSHGRPVVSIDGPLRWQALVDAGAVAVVPEDGAALAAALERLRRDPALRADAGRRAVDFYDAEMAVGRTGDVVSSLLSARSGPQPPAPAPGR
jgi:glycosyltransferase involved in cell wall biosynthesis